MSLTFYHLFVNIIILQLAWKSRWVHSSKRVPFLYKFMKRIKLTQGKYAIVDDEDFEWLNQWKWYYGCDDYAIRAIYYPQRRNICMHRLIINTPQGMETDHRNGNKLDNRRSNLRICTTAQNQMNRGAPSNNKSGYKGVYWSKQRKKWAVFIGFNSKLRIIGFFDNKIQAAKVYNQKAIELFGDFAFLNKI